MESVNRTLKSVLHIISVLQDICDKRRTQIERQNCQEYHIYLKEWKQKQKKVTNLCSKENDLSQVKKEAEVKSLVEEMEEIALVDSLLKKARNIRMKSKDSEPFNDSTSTLLSESSKSTPKPRVFESQPKKELYISTQVNYKKVIPRSKSALPSTRLKTVVVPRSKSANVNIVPKEEKSLKNNRISTIVNSKKSAIISKQTECKISTESNSVTVTNKELKNFKKSHVIYNVCDTRVEGIENVSKTLNSDFPQDSHPSSFPTCRGFQSEFKQISSLKSVFRLDRGGFWYPFLSLKHRNFLSCQRNMTTLDKLTKAFELMHKIQETMVWIDLLALIGRGALSSIVLLDGNDVNVVRLCYYLESLYCENLQRRPLLDPN